MKANKAPEKIYLQICGDCNDNDCENCKFEDLEYDVTWSKDKIFDKDVEYTCTDVFIHKLECWMNENFYHYAGFAEGILASFNRTEDAIEDFKNYIKGE